MKKYIALLSFLLVASIAFSQNFEAPKKGAKIYVESNALTLQAGEETTFDLWIVRSKFAKKTNIFEPSFMTSSELTFSVVQDEADKDHYSVTVSAANASAGTYSSTVSARSIGTQKVIGTTLSFDVTAGNVVASKDGE